MADAISITCPDCEKKMKVPATAAGKKIRCPGCESVISVPAAKPKSKPKPVDTRVTTPAAQKKMAAEREEDEIARDPYGVTEMSLSPHCPHCAHELDPPDSRICLFCGYDMNRRQRVGSVQVYERTAADFILWHLPTLGCILGIVAIVLGCLYYHYWLPEVVLKPEHAKMLAEDRWGYFETENADWTGIMFHWGIQCWGIVIGLFLGWKFGRFAFTRLFFHFLPAERKKTK